MKYKVSNKLVLEFTDKVLEQFNKYRQTGKRKESGGILLGQVFDTKIVIDEITTPSLCDKAGQFFFIRNVKRAQMVVDAAWAKSNGTRIYLGEWHTHPVLNPFPSNEDKKLIQNMLKYSRMEIDFLFLVIVGLGENDLYVGYQKKGHVLNKLSRL
ncbi:Mov34/MPN/PAD-1 family protein [Desulfallas sp. Bu1-1]|uniref:Mov34/MPN/PAD-1 family protein n=1 Tax=Desulfallas sp. Bu1-1 TaxID=2787620 RepID=UPI00189C682B|nr:Mov34/MPN/PAD-1 family protein [Desulfallas sp. Bu1-1]MBF7082789.1 Mov34/MPN/PAD-1 family protein [Desulfallas sp. Bu1-1]